MSIAVPVIHEMMAACGAVIFVFPPVAGLALATAVSLAIVSSQNIMRVESYFALLQLPQWKRDTAPHTQQLGAGATSAGPEVLAGSSFESAKPKYQHRCPRALRTSSK
jgi:hypothetical protein